MGSREIEEKPSEPETMATKQVDQTESIELKEEEDGEDDDGPPPGWQHIVRSPPSPPPTEIKGSKKLEDGAVKVEFFGDQEKIRSNEIEGKEVNPAYVKTMESNEINEERGEGEEVNLVRTETVGSKQIKGGDDDDDGPPPGWHPIDLSPSKLSPSLPPTARVGSKEIEKGEEVEADISGDQVRISSKEIKGEEIVSVYTEGAENEEIKEEEDDDGPPPGWQSVVHSPPRPSPPVPPTEMAQMVCGFCRQLLSYPREARHVKCSSCQTINLVLEEHQVGQVKCGNCTILLMYPYGAPSVRCSCCRFVTQIGDHNKRPPWSTQQGRPIPTPHPVQ